MSHLRFCNHTSDPSHADDPHISSNWLLTLATKRCESKLISEDGSTDSGKRRVYLFRYSTEELREVATLAENRWPV